MKIIYSGLESSGKSLKLAMVATQIAERNADWNEYLREHGKQPRVIFSNMKFSESFENWCFQNGVPLRYWKTLDELIEMDQCDVIIDEVGNYFDARNWQEVTLDQRRWLTQGAKSGIEIYGGAQDFAQVDKSFRRLVNELYHIVKLVGSPRPAATKPPVERIWGVCAVFELNPREYQEDKKEQVEGAIGLSLPSFMFIQRRYCEIFDTGQKITKSPPLPLRHIKRNCPDCGVIKLTHI